MCHPNIKYEYRSKHHNLDLVSTCTHPAPIRNVGPLRIAVGTADGPGIVANVAAGSFGVARCVRSSIGSIGTVYRTTTPAGQ